MVKDEDEEGEKVEKNWMARKVLHLIAPRGEMELEFVQNAKKKKVNFVFILEFSFQL
jgi:hypothetical protein